MISRCFILFLVVLAANLEDSCFAQTDSIKVFRIIGGYEFQQHQVRLKRRDLLQVTKTNETAYKMMKAANGSHMFSQISGGFGGWFLGLSVGNYIFNKNMNWVQFGIGVLSTGLSVGLMKNYKVKTLKAVNIYNSGLSAQQKRSDLKMDLTFSGNQIGLKLSF